MRYLTCAATRRALGLLHDDELEMAQQIAVEAHLSECADCARRRDELTMIRVMVRTGVTGPESDAYDDELLAGLMSSVVVQTRVERRFGWCERVARAMVEASRVWIPGGAVAMTVGAAVILAVVLSVSTSIRHDSLAAVLEALGSPGSNANPVSVARGVTIPTVSADRALPIFLSMPPFSTDTDLALAAVVTREGEISQVEVLRANDESDEFALDLARLAADVRFSPALYGGSPVAVNVVWVVERTTVRGDVPPVPLS